LCSTRGQLGANIVLPHPGGNPIASVEANKTLPG
jgi:hypothetical protein